MSEILLGYEVGTGKPVHIAPQHMVTLGMTQLSGKTTTNQAIIVRSGAKAVAFITKRGETGFIDFNLMRPYYKSQRGWQYVESLIDVALGEKVKYEPRMRYAIMKVSRGMKDLRDVREKAVKYLQEAKKEWDKEVYSKLIAYLDLVLPELEAIDFADTVELKEGVNVMNLVGMKLETQQLIIASTLQYIYQHLSNVIAIIPEAWEHLPQSRRTPVKFVAEQFIRKGASVRNYLWLDSQDIGGIDKTPLRQVSTWIMGRMMEAHEVERILKQLLGFKIPAREIQTLPLGHFYVTVGNKIQKVYVLPSGISEEVGIEVAKGIRTPESVKEMLDKKRLKNEKEDDDLVFKERFEEEKRKRLELEKEFARQVERLSDEKTKEKIEEIRQKASREAMKKVDEIKSQWNVEEMQQTIVQLKDDKAIMTEQLKAIEIEIQPLRKLRDALGSILFPIEAETMKKVEAILARPSGEPVPSEVSVSVEQPPLTVKKTQEPVELSQNTVDGRIAIAYAEGLLKTKWFTKKKLNNILEQRFGKREPTPNFQKPLTNMTAWGYFEFHKAGPRSEWRVKLSPKQAREKGLLKDEA